MSTSSLLCSLNEMVEKVITLMNAVKGTILLTLYSIYIQGCQMLKHTRMSSFLFQIAKSWERELKKKMFT